MNMVFNHVVQFLMDDYGFMHIIDVFIKMAITITFVISICVISINRIVTLSLLVIFSLILGFLGLYLGLNDLEIANKYSTPVQKQNLQRCIREYRAAHPSDLAETDLSDNMTFQKVVSFCADKAEGS